MIYLKENNCKTHIRLLIISFLHNLNFLGCDEVKTFKAVRFQIIENGGITEFELEDGVIINKENSGTGWLLEVVISNAHYETMKKYYDDQTLLDIRVVITRPSNDPALFDATIKSISEFETTMSIVFDCHIYTCQVCREFIRTVDR